LIKGIGRKVGFDVIEVSGATGGVDTDFEGKAHATLQALRRYDLVVLHVGAVNEACHEANPLAKIAAIESVDAGLLEPLLAGLEKIDPWRMMVATDHITSSQELSRVRGPVPVAFCGHEVEGIRHYAFTEANAGKSDLFVEKGHNLMEFFLGIKRAGK
jgi:2,3-bisphosphoglycerate-independent phosphoglycerate mutase